MDYAAGSLSRTLHAMGLLSVAVITLTGETEEGGAAPPTDGATKTQRDEPP